MKETIILVNKRPDEMPFDEYKIIQKREARKLSKYLSGRFEKVNPLKIKK